MVVVVVAFIIENVHVMVVVVTFATALVVVIVSFYADYFLAMGVWLCKVVFVFRALCWALVVIENHSCNFTTYLFLLLLLLFF